MGEWSHATYYSCSASSVVVWLFFSISFHNIFQHLHRNAPLHSASALRCLGLRSAAVPAEQGASEVRVALNKRDEPSPSPSSSAFTPTTRSPSSSGAILPIVNTLTPLKNDTDADAMPQIKHGRVLRSATAAARSTATSTQAIAGNRKRTTTAAGHFQQEDSDDNIVVAHPARRARLGDRDVGDSEEENTVVTYPAQTVSHEEQEQDIDDEIVVTRPAGPAYTSDAQRNAALQSLNRVCNGCMEYILNEHYSCPSCDRGDLKLCLICVFRGQQCPVQGHQLVKRLLMDGLCLDLEPGSSAAIAAGNATAGHVPAGHVAGDATAGHVPAGHAAGDAAAGDAAAGDAANAVQAVTTHAPDVLERCNVCLDDILPGQQLKLLCPCEHEMHLNCFDTYYRWTESQDKPLVCLRCTQEIEEVIPVISHSG
ncbi:ZZ type zinc finger domain [Lecanosticta acicola]|uniref:ZZ type zinc finger domain n=1 Tax=Lecanosticta acicola TaxID=111012 RepID=A0AAI8YYJ6_9PEZI|nr:ZZ type zinc finger domain [Lecanosticta acicola]